MFSRKFSNTIHKKKRLLISILTLLVITLGLGYSAFTSNFSFLGSLDVTGHMEPTLYNVLKKEAVTGGLAREYTGSHGDSMDSSLSTEKIYHWYATNNDEGTEIQNKNNVIFAGQCWQMIRTTDTGGVKMIYNGEAENNQCLNTRGNHVGYSSRTLHNLASNYWYGTDYTYDKTNNVFSISGTTEQATWNATTGSGLIGKYTCKGTNETDTCATIYLIESYYNTSSAYVIPLNSSSQYSQLGKLKYNESNFSLADVGYMYNTRYTKDSKSMTSTQYMTDSLALDTSYWYADTVTWGNPIAGNYNLDNPYQVSSTNEYLNLVGKYTFRNTSQNYTNSSVYYIAAVSGNTMYTIYLGSSSNHTLTDVNFIITYGDSYTDNGNGTYTINNPSTINRSDWYSGYNNVGVGKYVCKNAVNDTCSDLWYTVETANYKMEYIKVADEYKYANGFTYNDSTGKYTLNNDSVSFWNIIDSTNNSKIDNHHYTCWNDTGECSTISYIYYFSGRMPYYINLNRGKGIEDALDDMLTEDNVNSTNSTIKSGIDAWYKHFLLEGYNDYIEDTVYCNDRSISSLGGWKPTGGSPRTHILFNNYDVSNDLSCTNETDKFSGSNNKAHLAYKVGLMSLPEMNLLNHPNIRKTGEYYWLSTPKQYTDCNSECYIVSTTGSFASYILINEFGVRPAISLASNIEYSDGDGSMEKPYYVGDVYNITNSNDLFKVRKKAAPNYEVQILSDYYDVISFKLNGTLVNGDTFIMPEEDVTITDIQYVQVGYSIIKNDNDINVPHVGRYGSTITLESDNYKVTSFKLNGTLVNGDSFVMPAENVTITDITKIPKVIVESEHNPYANGIDNVIYYENTFENATSLTVELTYQTESTTYDWIYLYDSSGGSPINNKKYGGTTLTTETITVNSNYIKILFKTDVVGNNYYGFKAVIYPNYD